MLDEVAAHTVTSSPRSAHGLFTKHLWVRDVRASHPRGIGHPALGVRTDQGRKLPRLHRARPNTPVEFRGQARTLGQIDAEKGRSVKRTHTLVDRPVGLPRGAALTVRLG